MKRLFLLLLLAAAACSSGPDTTKPPEIVYGQDVCERCNMIISEERFAAAYWSTEGVARRFDDVGGMLAYVHEEGEDVTSYWVHDYSSGEWLAAEAATYAFVPDVITPMGFGVVAFASAADAETAAADQEAAEILSFDQLLAEAQAGNVDFYAHPPHGAEDDSHQE